MSSLPKNRIHERDEREDNKVPNDDKKNQSIKKSKFDKVFNFVISNSNLISIVILILSIYFYILSLEGCFDTQAECLKNLNEDEVKKLLGLISRCAFLLSTITTAYFYRLINHLVFLLTIAIYAFLCFYYDTGANLDYHGSYNRIVLILLYSLWLLSSNMMIILIRGLRKRLYITLFFLAVCISALFTFYKFKIITSCNSWKKGLKDSELLTNDTPCKITIPEVCWIDILGDTFDYSKWLNDSCSIIRNGDKTLFEIYFKDRPYNFEDTNIIGFPRTEAYSYKNSYHGVYDYKTLKELKDMEKDNNTKDIEVTIDFKNSESKVNIDIKRDEKLVYERKKLIDKNQLLSKNLMIVYIDALSRTHFLRKMPKTKSWLEKFYKVENSKLSTYQFFKLHSLGYFTQINVMPAFFGRWWLQGGGKHFTKYFKQKGAIISQTFNQCGRAQFDLNQDAEDFNWEKYDHELSSLMCDPNYHQADNPYTPFLGPYSIKRRCLHGRDTHDYELEYGKKFWETYKDMPKVLTMSFIDAHEGTGNVIKYLDSKLEKFLSEMENENMLDDTVILFMADHGNNMPGFISMLDSLDFRTEKYLPMMFMVVPEDIKKRYGKNLEKNEQSLITPWDIYNTILDFANAPENDYLSIGRSILDEIDNNEFTCNKFKIRDDFCVCK